MAEVVHIKVEGVLDELILHSMQVLNQTFFNSSTINQAESFDLMFEFKEEFCEDHLIVLLPSLHVQSDVEYLGHHVNLSEEA